MIFLEKSRKGDLAFSKDFIIILLPLISVPKKTPWLLV